MDADPDGWIWLAGEGGKASELKRRRQGQAVGQWGGVRGDSGAGLNPSLGKAGGEEGGGARKARHTPCTPIPTGLQKARLSPLSHLSLSLSSLSSLSSHLYLLYLYAIPVPYLCLLSLHACCLPFSCSFLLSVKLHSPSLSCKHVYLHTCSLLHLCHPCVAPLCAVDIFLNVKNFYHVLHNKHAAHGFVAYSHVYMPIIKHLYFGEGGQDKIKMDRNRVGMA